MLQYLTDGAALEDIVNPSGLFFGARPPVLKHRIIYFSVPPLLKLTFSWQLLMASYIYMVPYSFLEHLKLLVFIVKYHSVKHSKACFSLQLTLY